MRVLLLLRAAVVIACFLPMGLILLGQWRGMGGHEILTLVALGFGCKMCVWTIDRARQWHRTRRAESLNHRLEDPKNARGAEIVPYALYLRPFCMDGELGVARQSSGELFDPLYLWHGLSTDVETTLAELAEHRGLLMVGLGGPTPALGKGPVSTSDDQWVAMIRRLAPAASRIFVIPGAGEGLRQEVSILLEAGLLNRCIFVRPPAKLFASRVRVESIWGEATAALGTLGVELPEEQGPGGAVFTLHADGQLNALKELPKWSMTYLSRAVTKVQGNDVLWFIPPLWLRILSWPFMPVFWLIAFVARRYVTREGR